MPGASIGNPIPRRLRPESASVLDSPVTKALRVLATLVGANDPQGQVLGSMNPLPTAAIGIVPRKPAEALLGNFTSPLRPEAFNEAVRYLAARYPRLMSHVEDATPHAKLNLADDVAAYVSGGAHGPIRFGQQVDSGASVLAKQIQSGVLATNRPSPISLIAIDGRVMRDKQDYLKTMAHELAHTAQNLRQTDRALRVADQPTFNAKYTAKLKEVGYEAHPDEQAARTTADRQVERSRAADIAKRMFNEGASEEDVRRAFSRMTFKPADVNLALRGAMRSFDKHKAAQEIRETIALYEGRAGLEGRSGHVAREQIEMLKRNLAVIEGR